jgi:protein-S-isoprenylcysteine O-methyltransferase Ste14
MKKVLSILLPVSLIALIIGITACKVIFYDITSFQIGIIVIYVLGILYELSVSFKDYSESHVSHDKLSREGYAFSQAFVILSAIWFSSQSSFRISILGLFLLLLGLFIRIYSIRYLGKYYSHKARLLKSHKVISTGPYSVIRHPAYAGMIIIHIGILILFFNYITLVIFCLLFIPFILLRINIEEWMLSKINGYKKYSRSRKRLVPFIW